MTEAVATPAVEPAASTDLGALLDEPSARPWYRRPLPWIILAAALLLAGGTWWWLQRRAANALPLYSTQAVGRRRPHTARHRERHDPANALDQHRQ